MSAKNIFYEVKLKDHFRLTEALTRLRHLQPAIGGILTYRTVVGVSSDNKANGDV